MTDHIIEAESAALPEGFFDLPALIYADDPHWIPEDPTSTVQAFDSGNPWYLAGGESAAFCIPGKARLATFVGPQIQLDGEPAAYFGYWETVGDAEADDAIFAAAERWAHGRGARSLNGPVNFTTFGQYRLRTSATDSGMTFANEPYNAPYYPEILERLQFAPVAEALTQITSNALAIQVTEARLPAIESAKEDGFVFKPFTHEMWLERLPELHVIVDAMFRRNWGYSEISLEVFERVCGEKYIRKSCPKTSTAVFAPDGRLAGFFLVIPHWGPLLMQSAGDRRVSLSDIDYDTHWPQLLELGTPAAVPKTSAVLAEFQGRRMFTALATELVVQGRDIYDTWYGALIGADKNNRHLGEGLGAHVRWYAVYGKGLDA